MSETRKSSLILAVAGVSLVLAAYVGAYYATVQTENWRLVPVWMPHYGGSEEVLGDWIYPIDDCAVAFFAPMNWLDRRLRPHVWERP